MMDLLCDTIKQSTYSDGSRKRLGETTALLCVRGLLLYIGEDPNRDGLKDTPARVLRALTEMTAGMDEKPEEILGRVFEEKYDEMIIVRDIPFTSMCEHHLLTFSGTAHVGYIPGKSGKVVGLSKIARLVDCFSRRLQIQERLTRQIAETIEACLSPIGVAVVLQSEHSCMTCRGVKKPGTLMTTSCMLGVLREKAEARAEFLELCK